MESTGLCFHRGDLRKRASSYLRALLGRVQRKNGWQLAEHIGDATPHGIQRLLDSGLKHCFLFTDLMNPTSNHIYQEMVYRPVADVQEFAFE